MWVDGRTESAERASDGETRQVCAGGGGMYGEGTAAASGQPAPTRRGHGRTHRRDCNTGTACACAKVKKIRISPRGRGSQRLDLADQELLLVRELLVCARTRASAAARSGTDATRRTLLVVVEVAQEGEQLVLVAPQDRADLRRLVRVRDEHLQRWVRGGARQAGERVVGGGGHQQRRAQVGGGRRR